MTPRVCVGCGTPEDRKQDARGQEVTNLEPSTGLCLACLVKQSASGHVFHSRREDRKGEAVDVKSLQARNDS
jgi:hypothetical protein